MSILDSMGRDEDIYPRINGVTVGVVTNNKDPEKLGRVKLKLPLRECVNETDWVRIATLMAGKEMGAFFLPEVGDEVLVAFNEGDVRRPYVIGMLWNSVEKPPETNEDGKNNIRKIKSRNGNTITFSDENSKEKIEIKTKKGQVVLLEDEGSGSISIKDGSGNNKVIIDGGSSQVTLEADMKIVIKAGSCSVEIDSASNTVKVESSANLKLKGQMVEIEAGASMNIKSGGILNIKGTMVKIN